MPRLAWLLPPLMFVAGVNRCCLSVALALLLCDCFCRALLMLLFQAIDVNVCVNRPQPGEVHPSPEYLSWRAVGCWKLISPLTPSSSPIFRQ